MVYRTPAPLVREEQESVWLENAAWAKARVAWLAAEIQNIDAWVGERSARVREGAAMPHAMTVLIREKLTMQEELRSLLRYQMYDLPPPPSFWETLVARFKRGTPVLSR